MLSIIDKMEENQGKDAEQSFGKYMTGFGEAYDKFRESFSDFLRDLQSKIEETLSSAKKHTDGAIQNSNDTNRQLISVLGEETDRKLGELRDEVGRSYNAAIENRLKIYGAELHKELRNLFEKVKKGFDKRLDVFESEIRGKTECVDELTQRLESLEEGVKQYGEDMRLLNEESRNYVDSKFAEGNERLIALRNEISGVLSEQTSNIVGVVNKKGGELVKQYTDLVASLNNIGSRVEKVESIREGLVSAVKETVQKIVAKVELSPVQKAELKMLVSELIDQYVREEFPERIKGILDNMNLGQSVHSKKDFLEELNNAFDPQKP